MDVSPTVHQQFSTIGSLTNEMADNTGSDPLYAMYHHPHKRLFSHAALRDYLVSAFAIDLGNIQSTNTPVSWATGYVRNPSIQYNTPSGETQQRSPLYTAQYPTIDEAVSRCCSHHRDSRSSRFSSSSRLMRSQATTPPRFPVLSH